MSLAQLKVNILKEFESIGHKGKTAAPASLVNTFSTAYEYFVASTLSSMAKKRYDTAKKNAEKAGVLDGDFIPGETVKAYIADEFEIIAKTANPASRIDPAILRGKLVRELGEKKADEIIEFATVKNKAATSFSFVEK